MKKSIALFLMIAVFALFLSTFAGCENRPSDNSEKVKSGFDYNLILQMPKKHTSIVESIEYESLDEYKNKTFTENKHNGAIASVECIGTTFYITIRHDGEDIIIGGKAVAKCKITSIKEEFNSFADKVGTVFEFDQNYYIMPANINDEMEMFKSFGAVFSKDSNGEITGMELPDGDYVLEYKEGVEYILNLALYGDALPLEDGKEYTGIIISRDSKYGMSFISPIEDTQRYEVFSMSQYEIKMSAEIKKEFAN